MEEDPVKRIEQMLETTDQAKICQTFDDLLEKDASDADVWQTYIEYLKCTNNQHIIHAYSRYCKEFFDDIFAWQDYLFNLEKFGREWSQLEAVFNEGVQFAESDFSAMNLYRSITYARLRYVRATAQLEGTDPDYKSVAKLFENGDKFLAENFDASDPSYKRNYAYFAFTCLKDVELGRKLWKDILASGIGNKAKWWIEAAEMERRFGTIEAARRILYRGVNSVFEEPMELFDYFVQFEREEGSFDQVSTALKRVNDQAARIAQRDAAKKPKDDKQKAKKRKGQTETEQAGSATKKNKSSEVVIKDKDGFVVPAIPIRSPRRDGSHSPSNAGMPASLKLDKAPSPKHNNSAETPPKEPHREQEDQPMDVDENGGDKTVFLSNLDFGVTENQIKNIFPRCTAVRLLQRPGTDLGKGYGYVDFGSIQDAQEALKMDRAAIKGRPLFVSEYKPHEKGQRTEFKYSTDIERNKLFMKNLPFKCGNKELKEAFQSFGEITDARIVTKKSGQSKCCGYVDFLHEADAMKVLSSQIEIGGRQIQAYISNPPKKQPDKPIQFHKPFNSKKPQLGKPQTGGVNVRKPKLEAFSFVPRAVAVKKT